MSERRKVMCNSVENLDELQKILTPEQYAVVVQNGTEAPFRNKYWDNHHPGIYVDVISGRPLFSSKDKFDSGSGWPSFAESIDSQEIVEKIDTSYGMVRTEVRSKTGNGHLGHLFDDGPIGRGMRYCINSASLRFVPLENLESEGLGDYEKLFSASDLLEAKKNPYRD